jgi:PBP1b-binding outer membrane lipoprotein LpoB
MTHTRAKVRTDPHASGKDGYFRGSIMPSCFRASFCLFFLLTGCEVASVLAYKLGPPETIKAQYTPPKTPILVLAENFQNPSMCSYEAEQIAWEIGRQLTDHQVAPVVSSDKLRQLRTETKNNLRKMTLSEIGQKTGAQQILYVNIRECHWEPLSGTRMVRGEVKVQVKMVDVKTGQTTWPDLVSDGTPMSAEMPYTEQKTSGDGVAMREKICHQLGDQIARLFYTYNADQ